MEPRETMKSWIRIVVPVALALALVGVGVACGTSSAAGGEVPDGAAEGSSPDGSAHDATVETSIPTGSGSGTATGSLGGVPFGAVATAMWAGTPDDPASTVIYLFSSPVACAEISTPGWDTRIADKSRVLEMKELGVTPQDYPVVTTVTPAPGEASVNYTVSSTSGTPKETGSSAGKVTLETLTPAMNATGSFTLTFATGTLQGTFDAVYCPGGHEP